MEPLSGALWQRLRQHAKQLAIDPRLTTELGRLNWFGELTSAQVAAGLRVGQVYSRYEKFRRLRRSPRSPSYEPSFGDPDIAEDRLDVLQLSDLEQQQRDARQAFLALQEQIPPQLRGAIETLCVENRHINPVLIADVRAVLDHLGGYFGMNKKKPSSKRPRPVEQEEPSPAPPREGAAQPRSRVRAIDRETWLEVLRKLRPDLPDERLEEALAIQQALSARAKFREEKAQKTKRTA